MASISGANSRVTASIGLNRRLVIPILVGVLGALLASPYEQFIKRGSRFDWHPSKGKEDESKTSDDNRNPDGCGVGIERALGAIGGTRTNGCARPTD